MKEEGQYLKWGEWSDEDGVYLGRYPDLISGIHGDDPITLYSELCETVAEVIAILGMKGDRFPSRERV